MAKRALKQALGLPPSADPALIDTDRLQPKAAGGTYDDLANVRLLEPRSHMARHGTLRERAAALAMLKATFDDRVQTMKLLLKVQNQELAYRRRTDEVYLPTRQFLKGERARIKARLGVVDRGLGKLLAELATIDRLAAVASAVRGLGPITVSALAVYVDLAKADSASSLWKYAGYDKPSHERYTANVVSGGNKTLRTVLYNTVVGMMKDKKSPYRLVYDRVKTRLAASEKVTKSRNTQGRLVECAWKDTKPSHRHGAALRAMAKHLLADYWFVGRELAGLSTRPLYVEAQLGHTGIVQPRERGWKW